MRPTVRGPFRSDTVAIDNAANARAEIRHPFECDDVDGLVERQRDPVSIIRLSDDADDFALKRLAEVFAGDPLSDM